MRGQIYLIQREGDLVPMPEQPYDSEALLQKLLADYPALLAGDQMIDGVPRRWLLVAREFPLSTDDSAATWYVDHLFLDQDGIPTIVEVKQSSDYRVRREVIGQMLDYAACLVGGAALSKMQARLDIDPATRQRFEEFLGDADPQGFWESVRRNIDSGRIRMVFVADEIPPELRRVVDFLAVQLRSAEVFAVEVRHFQSPDARALVPQLISMPKSPAEAAVRKKWDERSFFEELGRRSPERSEIARHLFDWSKRTMTDFYYGSGATQGSCIPRLFLASRRLLLFALWTYGTVEMQFQYLRVPPFNDVEMRKDLIQRLNSIPGISIPENAVDRRPSFDLAALQEEEPRKRFLEAMQWAIDLARAANESS